MDFRRILFVTVVFFTAAGLASGYTIVLKSGKKIEGGFVEEDASKILIKDKDGIILTFRKSTLDLDAMTALNAPKDMDPAETTDDESCCETGQTDPVPEDRSTDKPRVFTNEDLKDLPEISILGSEHPTELPEPEPQEDSSNDQGLDAERYWKQQTVEIANRLYEAEDNYNAAKKACDDAKEAFAWFVLNGYWGNGWAPADPAYICDQANQAHAEWDRWKDRLDKFQEQARRQGALPGWVDPERLNR